MTGKFFITDLIHDGRLVRFAWVSDKDNSPIITVLDVNENGNMTYAENLTRDVARARWSWLIQKGWKRVQSKPIYTLTSLPDL